MKTYNLFFLSFMLVLPGKIYVQSNVPEPAPLLEPPPVTFSFNTPGWYVVGALLLMGAVTLIYRWLKKYKANAYRRRALHELDSLKEAIAHDEPSNSPINTAFILLKSVAITAYGRLEAGPLHGKEWLQFLDDKGNGVSFTAQEAVIKRALFLNEQLHKEEQMQLLILTKNWIKNHA